jgi:hypothetical protein
MNACLSGTVADPTLLGIAPTLEIWEQHLADERQRLLSLVAHRLAVRTAGRLYLRAMLHDVILGIEPGSAESLIRGATDGDIAHFRSRLILELVAAMSEVAETTAAPLGDDLRRLAREVATAFERRRTTTVLRDWIVYSLRRGVAPSEFLQVYL